MLKVHTPEMLDTVRNYTNYEIGVYGADGCVRAAEEIGRKADVGIVKLERVKEIERENHHDIIAMVVAFT